MLKCIVKQVADIANKLRRQLHVYEQQVEHQLAEIQEEEVMMDQVNVCGSNVKNLQLYEI